MIEPALVLDATMTAGEALDHLETYPAFRHAVVHRTVNGEPQWFADTVDTIRWLLADAATEETLAVALALDEEPRSPVHDLATAPRPAGFTGVVLAQGDLVGVVLPRPADPSGSQRERRPAEERETTDVPAEEQPSDARYVVPVFFATDRERTAKAGPAAMFGAGRGRLQFGQVDVSIPPGHRRGEVETPKWWKLEFSADPAKHLTFRGAEHFEDDGTFSEALARRFSETGRRAALIFVHGYNVSFDAAVLRTAQIAFDLRFRGAAVLYSWPSGGKVLDYTRDENNALWTVPHFEAFLRTLLDGAEVETVHVIAHSMGNRVVTDALREMSDVDTSRLDQVVLAAPDIDADVFRQLSPKVTIRARQFTLYASSKDLALRASKLVHGYQRAGDTDPEVLVVLPVVSVDASEADTNLLGHSYIGDGTSILADIDRLLETGAPPQERRFFLDPVDRGADRYWVFKS